MSDNIFDNPNDLFQSLKNLEDYENYLKNYSVYPLNNDKGFDMKPSKDGDTKEIDVDTKVGPDLYEALEDYEKYGK